MSRVIRVGNKLVPVSEEIYQEYYKMARRERYLEKDRKVGRIKVDMEKEKVTFIDSKEDSMQRLMEQGADFADDQVIEDILCDKAELLILQQAMSELDREEQDLIRAIYYRKQSTRQIAERENVSQPTIVKRHKKVLDKLRKHFL